MSDLLKTYNPANAAALTPEEIEGMRNLTLDEIKQLAKVYPNLRFPRAYLLIIDTKSKISPERQLPSLSTWENLYNLNSKNNGKYVATGFRGAGKQKPVTVRPRRSEVRDLSDVELLNLPGFTMPAPNGQVEVIQPQTVPVAKIETAKRGRPKKS